MSNMPLLRGKNLEKNYKIGISTLTVLRGVSFDVQTGEFLALRGASGAGKSTLLHLLGGLDTPNSGEIWFKEQNIGALTERERSRYRNERVGFIFQAYHLFPELDALENVMLPGRIMRRPMGEIRKKATELLGRVGLSARLNHRPAELSGGEQQRVAIARSLINQPEIILADEPTGNLDSKNGEEIINLLCSLQQERNTTLIIATHDASVAARAPRTIDLVDGKAVGM
jgi:ABC-type lipoprotein export system ATPase subunit